MSAPPPVAEPRLAAAIILLRPAPAHDDAEVFLLRRAPGMAAFADAWVFPGGKIDAADEAAEAGEGDSVARPVPAAARRLLEVTHGAWSEVRARAVCAAACRETFEEAGVLLASSATGQPAPPAVTEQLRTERAAMVADPARFYAALAVHALTLDLHALVYWAHWITPSTVRHRFDTRFFVASLAREVTVDHARDEAHAAHWQPLRVLAEQALGRPPVFLGPTAVTILELARSLARHGSIEAMLAAERAREVLTITPAMLRAGDEPWVVLPWDPQYAALPGAAPVPGLRWPERYASLPSRLPLPNFRD